MSKTAPAKTCTFQTDYKKCCIFQEETNEDFKSTPIPDSPKYNRDTMIATKIQHFDFMPTVSFVVDHVR